MSLPSKILWGEGQLVAHHQFQQQDHYHEDRLQRAVAAVRPHLWGVNDEVRWNTEQLLNNLLSAQSMSCIFQDGTFYEAPNADPLPPVVNLSNLPLTVQVFTFYAALPTLNKHGGNLANMSGAHNGARYAANEQVTRDLFTDAGQTDVFYLNNTVRLMERNEARDGYYSFPVIRLRRLVGGGFEEDKTFIPPRVYLRESSTLHIQLKSLLGTLESKMRELYSRHWQTNRDTVEVHGGDLSSFWLLNTISTVSASLTHCANYARHHPENLFDRLMSFAGGLMTFSTKYALGDLPTYQHEDPAAGFARLDAIIRDLIDTLISSRYFKIALIPPEEGKSIHRAQLDPSMDNSKTALYLAINADMPALELVAAVPRLIKVAAPDDLEKMIAMSLPGLNLVHMAQVPPEVPVRPSTYYFLIENKGTLYEDMLKVQKLAIHVLGGINGLKIEAFGVAP
ncbi:type VI secretion system baseplate subunit TssK [Massilia sp. DWR3-1-1]|uniref:type VI secretion system baseplate subunit TssK n=1 Tax=Massilia sp. DWR3-1-1 TaxID=2804559 RepID=UPI003CEC2754